MAEADFTSLAVLILIFNGLLRLVKLLIKNKYQAVRLIYFGGDIYGFKTRRYKTDRPKRTA